MNAMFKFVLLCLSFGVCCCYKLLLVFPMPAMSHTILGEGFVRHLVEAGHEVTYITPLPVKNPSSKLRQIDVSENFHVLKLDNVLSVEKLMTKELDMTDLAVVKEMMVNFANATIHNPKVRKFMEDPNEKFDAVIAEWLYTEIYSGFASIFECPLIWSSSMDPHAMVLWLVDDWPNPAYFADHMSSKNPPFTFWERAKELWTILKWKRMAWSSYENEYAIYNSGFGPAAELRGVQLKPLSDMMYNASLMLGNSHISTGQPIRLPQNYKNILGYHIKDEMTPLPKMLQKIMDDAEHGVIYFSMGSNLKSKSLPDQVKKDLLVMFGKLKQTVLWKFEEKLAGLPKNVKLVDWAPQQSILGHPNCVLFITHGGLLSITETVHFGIPIIGIPMFADQFLNINRAVLRGFAKKVDMDWDLAKNLGAAIDDILGDRSYHERVNELSFIYHDRPTSPGAELVHWVQHVVNTRGAPHLRSPALHVPFYQKLYLDLLAAVLIAIYITSVVKYLLFAPKDKKIKQKQR